jgi:hypothetical protein
MAGLMNPDLGWNGTNLDGDSDIDPLGTPNVSLGAILASGKVENLL